MEFSESLKKLSGRRRDSVNKVQDALIKRILNFPTKIDLLNDVVDVIPAFIARNKQIYEIIFTFLQVHPCYLFNLVTKTFVARTPE